ncbi:MAG: hypothetical protein RL244_2532 [Pseudomonadota bacterium]|jgi:pyruvate,orthophosphate dikinase
MTTHHPFPWPDHLYLIANPAATGKADHSPFVRNGVAPNRDTMGSKAFNLLRMAQAGLPVPSALVLGTHYAHHRKQCIRPLFDTGIPALEQTSGYLFGDTRKPLIVSVRSGAPISMPGMMETLLNIGLCDATLPGLLRQTGNPRLVWDAYRRLVASFGEVVEGLPASLFENALQDLTQGRDERLLDFSELRQLTRTFLALYAEHAGHPFPQDVRQQLARAVLAVFSSWDSNKAREYRKLNGIDSAMGTAVTIQRMVFGNAGGRSGAGVGFTRNPSNGEPALWIDFLANAQGEDVVSGRRNAHGHEAMADLAPEAWEELSEATRTLEQVFGDMQDFEFTVEDSQLYLLQARSGKRTPLAAARIALDLHEEGLIDRATALQRTEALQDAELSTAHLASDSGAPARPVGQAASACSGVCSGEIALDPQRAAKRAAKGKDVILVRNDAETNDIAALEQSVGLLTRNGARTSHAAVVARQLGKVCLVGCETLRIDSSDGSIQLGELTLREGDTLTLDGNQGLVYQGYIATVREPDQQVIERLGQLRKGK